MWSARGPAGGEGVPVAAMGIPGPGEEVAVTAGDPEVWTEGRLERDHKRCTK